MTREELRAMRERRFAPAKPAKTSRGGWQDADPQVVPGRGRAKAPKNDRAIAVVASGPRETYKCPVCEARRQAKRASMAKWRAKTTAKTRNSNDQ